MPILTPEQQARDQVDRLLQAAGWEVQPREGMRLRAARGVEETANLPEPDVLAAEIVEELESALEQFRAIAKDLGEYLES
jgi:hypothetical protein